MNFDFTAEETQFAERVRRFAREHLAKDALKRAHAPGFPFDVAALMAKQGLMGISLPESEGGQGGSLMDAVIAIMEVAAECPRSADVVQFAPLPNTVRRRRSRAGLASCWPAASS
jgi:alkylation response protein AidB-like acyl-CoA dehydrogenase